MKDFLGKDIAANDSVIFRIGGFRGLCKGRVVFTDHKAHVELLVGEWMANRPLPVKRIVYAVSSVDIYKI